MAAAGNCATTLRVAVTLFLIITLAFPPSISVYGGSSSSSSSSSSSRAKVDEIVRRKGVLGSRPPGCINKCRNCRPCEATLVIPPHQANFNSNSNSNSNSHRDDDTYYLLSWKCRCGDRLFQP